MNVVNSPEQQRVQEIADEYRRKGYDVTLEPKKEHLPDFLALYRPNMLAHKGGESVIVEVKTRAALAQSDYTQRLARTIEEHPGWRLDLILTNPNYLTREEVSKVLGKKDITHVIQEVEKLRQEGFNRAALLLSWSAAEATLRRLALKESVAFQQRSSRGLLEQLTTEGILSREDYRSLADTLKLRNEVAHGFKTDLSQAQVRRPLELIQRLLEEVNT